MRMSGSAIELSASDLSGFLSCIHLTALDLAVARGGRERPTWVDPVLIVLRERGLDHERGYVQELRAQGLVITDLDGIVGEDSVSRSIEAILTGADVILQPALRNSRWFGRPDVLRRNGMPSALGAWSYEVVDTKLAKETRGGTILQLGLYSELLSEVQGRTPEYFRVVTPDPVTPVHTYRVDDFAAYFRLIRNRLETTSLQDHVLLAAENYPEQVDHCEICRWQRVCYKKRRVDDHLSLVAGMRRLQSGELEASGVGTLAQLGELSLPIPFTPARGSVETYIRLREQARVQLEGRIKGEPVHELLLPIEVDQGLARLPVPSAGDLFLDLEGARFARDGGREYLFGLVILEADGSLTSRSYWAHSDVEERAAFEAVVDKILRCWDSNPGMHVYHYAPYEPSAFKRLMGRYATREAEVDRMLRGRLFVDLYSVIRRALRASVEKYSIKDLEPFYRFTRAVRLVDANINLRAVERALEASAIDVITPSIRAAVEGYNLDDCKSALQLRGWLEQLRASLEAAGTEVPRPQLADGTASEPISERARRVQVLFAALTEGVPLEETKRTPEQQAQWLLAHLLDFHRREAKAPWWDFFRLRGLREEELFDEKAAVGGLSLVARIGGTVRSPIDRYSYPLQEIDIHRGDELHLPDPDGTAFGSLEAIDRAARILDIKKRGAQTDVHPSALFAHSLVNSDALAESLLRIADDVVAHGISSGPRYKVARETLLRRPPRLGSGKFEMWENETPSQFAIRIVADLKDTVLAIQGPPGSGKTYAGARMICELVRKGARVGVTSVSHKVISNLLKAVLDAAEELGLHITCAQKVTTRGDAPPRVDEITTNDKAIALLRGNQVNVVGGTSWLWANPIALNAVDVLFVDEAGQMSLANVLAASQAARNVVLLGDPQQLDQPLQGSHPKGANVSALEHMLGHHKTIPSDRGIFLSETWRLAPNICTFTSEVFYERRLYAHAGLERQVLVGTAPFEGAGLWVNKVMHEGNQNSSIEEAEEVDRIVSSLLRPGARWIDGNGVGRPMTADDVLVVAPYNSQVALLEERLGPKGVCVGTVDKFQGQEAPVVIYSMTTSVPEDAPHGMEFLYSLNRLNVATSRARCACILVANPRLFEPECKTPRQMQLANGLCRYVELAQAEVLAPLG
jgi:predicted RecB family nuclease